MFVAGLTGGIASGKSTISKIFREAGAVIVDADIIAHTVVRKGSPAWERIKTHFGRRILLPDGEIDREGLGRIVFHDEDQKKSLNRIVHPFVFQKMEEEVAQARLHNSRAIVILDVPLLIETGMHQNLPEVILVYIPEDMQLSRLMARDGISRSDAEARIRAQMPIDEKRKAATVIIDNSGSIDHSRRQVRDAFCTLQTKERTTSIAAPFHLTIP